MDLQLYACKVVKYFVDWLSICYSIHVSWLSCPAAIAVSRDHKPDQTDERQRIEDAGGFVMWAGTVSQWLFWSFHMICSLCSWWWRS